MLTRTLLSCLRISQILYFWAVPTEDAKDFAEIESLGS
jgi:hypothetical protein